MSEYKRLDIVLVPFPFTDLKEQKLRPALIISDSMSELNNHAIFAMITSSLKHEWKNDIRLKGLDFLSKEDCVLRLGKVFTLDLRLARKKIGSLEIHPEYKESIKQNLSKMFKLSE
jgi:mRNA interferase MazF